MFLYLDRYVILKELFCHQINKSLQITYWCFGSFEVEIIYNPPYI